MRFNLELYRRLDPASRRLFLFLSKLFNKRTTTPRLELTHLATDILGYSQTIARRDIKIKVQRSIKRLEDKGILAQHFDHEFTKKNGFYSTILHRGRDYARVCASCGSACPEIPSYFSIGQALLKHLLDRGKLVIPSKCASFLHESSFRHIIMTYGDSLCTNFGELQNDLQLTAVSCDLPVECPSGHQILRTSHINSCFFLDRVVPTDRLKESSTITNNASIWLAFMSDQLASSFKTYKTLRAMPSNPDMIDQIRADVESGICFVPFIGSGMSAPSGILMGMEFTNFLAYTVYRVVRGSDENNEFGWNLKRNGWPAYPKDEEVESVRVWVYQKFVELCENNGLKVKRNQKSSAYEVEAVEFLGAGSDTPSAIVNALNRPLIPEIIRSRNEKTWRSEQNVRRLQEEVRGAKAVDDFLVSQSDSTASKKFVEESAISSLYDWRATLRFLARCNFDPNLDRVVVQDEIDQSIIDSFNVHITRGRQVNLGQKMLSHLSKPLRIRTILTTNFDRLLESAFQTVLTPLQVISVSNKGTLPSARSVRAQNSLVKLHGETIETRADFTLDLAPDKKEKDTFVDYVRGRFDRSTETGAVPGNLIVMGFSGSDARVIQMMKYLLDTRPDSRIYWVCYSKGDQEKVERQFGKEYTEGLCLDKRARRIEFNVTARPDLFLYELYQRVNLCLPSGGFSYEFTHKVPPDDPLESKFTSDIPENDVQSGTPNVPPGLSGFEQMLWKRSYRKQVTNLAANYVCNAVRDIDSHVGPEMFFPAPENAHDGVNRRMVKIKCEAKNNTCRAGKADGTVSAFITIQSGIGGTVVMREAFNRLVGDSDRCIWIELQDYADIGSLFEDVLRIFALRVGQFQLEHFILNPVDEEVNTGYEEKFDAARVHLWQLIELMDLSKNKWVVFLNGRDVPGSCSGWEDTPWTKKQYESESAGGSLVLDDLMNLFGGAGIHVVYAPFDACRNTRDHDKLNADAIKTVAEKQIAGSFSESVDDARHIEKQADALCKLDPLGTEDAVDKARDGDQPLGTEVCNSLGTYDYMMDTILDSWICVKGFSEKPYAKDLSNDEKYKLYLARLRFLYTASLFRQSRHTSAFFTEGVYQCPHRYNVTGTDNDYTRARNVRHWIEELRARNVFYWKSGGYSWKYRDVRLGIQRRLESIRFYKYADSIRDKFEAGEGETPLHFNFFREIRARSHFWIGDWYSQAFMATGHYIPVVESLYHRFQCVKFADVAAFRGEKYSKSVDPGRDQYRLTLVITSLREMTKIIKLSQPWLKFWLSGFVGHSLFTDPKRDVQTLRSRTLGWITNTDGKYNEDEIRRVGEEFDAVEHELKIVAQSLKGEARLSVQVLAVPNQVSVTSECSTALFFGSDTDPNDAFDKEVRGKEDKVLDELLDSTVLAEAGLGPTEEIDQKLQKAKRGWLQTIKKPKSSQTFEVKLLRSIQLVNELATVTVRRAKLETDAFGRFSKMSRRRWLQVTIICSTGLGLCRHLSPAFLREEIELKVDLNRTYGLALGFLGRPYESNRHLNEAQALISKSSRSFDGVEVAIVRLRRAEAVLARVEQMNYVIESTRQLLKERADEEKGENHDPNNHILIDRSGDQNPTSFAQLNQGFWEVARSNENGCKSYIWKLYELDLAYRLLREPQPMLREWTSEETKPSEVQCDPWIYQLVDGAVVVKNVAGKAVEKIDLTKLSIDLDRTQSALVDDAWVLLESAHDLLSGESHSSHWWSRWAKLKLWSYALLNPKSRFESCVFRKRIQHDNEVLGLFRKLVAMNPNGIYARVDAVAVAMLAMESLKENNSAAVNSVPTLFKSEVEAVLEQVNGSDKVNSAVAANADPSSRYFDLLKRYVKTVNEIAEELKYERRGQ